MMMPEKSASACSAAIFTGASGFFFLKSRKERLSFIVASARPVSTSWIDWSKPSVPTSSAPEAVASLPKLLVSD
ncbi:hypothetical protein D9M70_566060 [compost metagenome]